LISLKPRGRDGNPDQYVNKSRKTEDEWRNRDRESARRGEDVGKSYFNANWYNSDNSSPPSEGKATVRLLSARAFFINLHGNQGEVHNDTISPIDVRNRRRRRIVLVVLVPLVFLENKHFGFELANDMLWRGRHGRTIRQSIRILWVRGESFLSRWPSDGTSSPVDTFPRSPYISKENRRESTIEQRRGKWQ